MLLILLAVSTLLVCARWLPIRKRKHPPRIPATTPADPDALRSLQERIQAATRRVMGAVVAVEEVQPAGATRLRDFRPYCPGVIITPEGLILIPASRSIRPRRSGSVIGC
jgi:hypothetical protein